MLCGRIKILSPDRRNARGLCPTKNCISRSFNDCGGINVEVVRIAIMANNQSPARSDCCILQANKLGPVTSRNVFQIGSYEIISP